MTSSAAQKSVEAFRTISEVAETLKLPQHVLRFWETRFTQIRPLKRAGGRRFYRPEDVELLGAIRQLLYGEGYTIKGVQRILREQGPRAVALLAREHATPVPPPVAVSEPAAPADSAEHSPVPRAVVEASVSRDGLAEAAMPAWLGGPSTARAAATPDVASDDRDGSTDDPIERLRKVLDEIEACRHMLIAARG